MLEENFGSLKVELFPEERAELNAICPPGAIAGDRYQPEGVATLDL